ncbi:MAG: hypothetical protein KGL15_05935, partial [Acidobacteriota bacterium]|nr:hypothetical protein [Acidobacteriota bacterium]
MGVVDFPDVVDCFVVEGLAASADDLDLRPWCEADAALGPPELATSASTTPSTTIAATRPSPRPGTRPHTPLTPAPGALGSVAPAPGGRSMRSVRAGCAR